jgi:hypothetical protein
MYRNGWWIEDYVGRESLVAQGGGSYGSAFIRIIPDEQLAVIGVANTGALFEFITDTIVDGLVPEIRERRQSWTPPPAETRQRRPISPELAGTWTGAIDTYRGKRPLTISIDSTGAVTGSLTLGDSRVALTRTGTSGPRAFALAPEANLGIDEAKPGTYDVQLGLGLYGSHLAGFATTQARSGSSAPPLTFWVDLTRP